MSRGGHGGGGTGEVDDRLARFFRSVDLVEVDRFIADTTAALVSIEANPPGRSADIARINAALALATRVSADRHGPPVPPTDALVNVLVEKLDDMTRGTGNVQ